MTNIIENKEYPLFPELSEKGKQEVILIIENFKKEISKAAEDAIGQLYVGLSSYIESDSWNNFRNEIIDGFKNYETRLKQNDYDFKTIRQEIYKEYKTEIIKDLNSDLLKENEQLKKDYELLLEQYKIALR